MKPFRIYDGLPRYGTAVVTIKLVNNHGKENRRKGRRKRLRGHGRG